MADEDFPSDTASSGDPYKVGVMPTEDGDKVILILRADQKDQIILWLDAETAQTLAKALIVTACRIEEDGTDRPARQN